MNAVTILQSSQNREQVSNDIFERLYELDKANTQMNLSGNILITPGAYREQVQYMSTKYSTSLLIEVYNNTYFVKFRDNAFKQFMMTQYSLSQNITEQNLEDITTVYFDTSSSLTGIEYAEELVYTKPTIMKFPAADIIYFQIPPTITTGQRYMFAGITKCTKRIWYLNNMVTFAGGTSFLMFNNNDSTAEGISNLANRCIYMKNFSAWNLDGVFSYNTNSMFMVYSTKFGLDNRTSELTSAWYNGASNQMRNNITHFVINHNSLPQDTTINLFSKFTNVYVPQAMYQSYMTAIDNGDYLGTNGNAANVKAKFKTIENDCTIVSLRSNGIDNIYAIPQDRETEFCGLDANNKLILIQEYM